ncbi:hypothetical protein [Nodularia spumigena]|uniref:hypothetical protein n=1 Tax=Nodularia spumigena TaxID=70799 RepID=UPI002B213AB5|nr:hypothetical protein [Nodularia spumigena]MEA5614579.1 hypothetical protein [Nodularia spumigena UHCC 0040]
MSAKSVCALFAAALAVTSAAAGEHRFDFSGTITSGSAVGGTPNSLDGTAFTFSLFVLDTATDLTPLSSTANFRLARATLDLGSNGSIEESSMFPHALSAVYLDPGSTQLVGGFDLFNPNIAFMIGVNLPSSAFADPKNLTSQATFSLSGLTTSTLSYYNSSQYNLVFDVTRFGFTNAAFVIPLPAPVAMGALGLACAGIAARRRMARK